jgi:hypothetical protein
MFLKSQRVIYFYEKQAKVVILSSIAPRSLSMLRAMFAVVFLNVFTSRLTCYNNKNKIKYVFNEMEKSGHFIHEIRH